MLLLIAQNSNLKNIGDMTMCENDKKCDDDKDEKVNEFMQEYHEHGLGCGSEIANIAKEIHPNALLILPLYRSCIVIEQTEEEKKEGVCTLHSYADPHWCGGDIDIENLKSKRFHFECKIQGDRQGPIINLKDEERIFVENDEN